MLWLAGLVFFGSSPAARAATDFEAKRLEIPWGGARRSGDADLSASCRLRSDGRALHLEVRVNDDVLVLNDDPIHSDHVEIWLDVLGQDTRLFQSGAISEHLLRFSPEARPRAASQEDARRRMLAEFEALRHARDGPADAAGSPPGAALEPVREFFGLVHYGLLPKRERAVLYDLERYRRPPPAELGDLVEVSSERADGGYVLRARIPIEALGFVHAPRTARLAFRVDVVDVDGERQESVASTSAAWGWAETQGFRRLELAVPLESNVSGIPAEVLDGLGLEPVFRRTAGGWSAARRAPEPLVLGYRIMSQVIEEVPVWDPGYRYERLEPEGHVVHRVSYREDSVHRYPSEQRHYLVNGRTVSKGRLPSAPNGEASSWLAEHGHDAFFRYPDGSLGLVAHSSSLWSPYGWGQCGAADHHLAEVIRFGTSGPRTLLQIEEGSCTPLRIGPLASDPADWQMLEGLRWERPGERLLVEVGSGAKRRSYVVTWDADFAARVELAGAAPPPAAAELDGSIVPGVRVGTVTREVSEADLRRLHGDENIAAIDVYLGEGVTEPGTALFPGDPDRELEILWRDSESRREPRSVQIKGTSWGTRNGIRLGTTLETLEKLNGRPFSLAGFGWDYSGTVLGWEGGLLEKELASADRVIVRLMPGTGEIDRSVLGSDAFLSSHPAMQELAPAIYAIVVEFSAAAPGH